MDSDQKWVLIILLVWCVAFFLGGMANEHGYEAMREACEANLPRDQHCILIAVPEQEQK